MTHSSPTSIETHPDLMELRSRYERASETPMARVLYGLTFLAGLYAAISPWVVRFNETGTGRAGNLTVNNLITGLSLAVLALLFASAYGRTHNLSWVTPVLGVWLIISPWVIMGSAATARFIINNVVVGAVTLLVGAAIATLGLGREATRGRR